MKKNIKLISLIITAILLVGAVIGISVSAETEGQAIRIAGQNIAYEGAPQILYLVETKTTLEEGQAVKLVYSTTKFESVGTELPEGAVLKSVPMGENGEPLTVKANEKDYYPLFSDGIAPQNAAKAVYACPVIVDAEDNIVLAGKVVSYDVRQYARNRFAKFADENQEHKAQKALYTSLLDYAASIQEVMMTETEINANGGYADTYILATLNKVFKNEVFDTSASYYRPGEFVTTNKYTDTSVIFDGFTNEAGEVLVNDDAHNLFKLDGNDVTLTINANYEQDKKYGEYYTYEDNIQNVIKSTSRLGYSLEDVTATYVSYQYNGVVYKYPTVTTLTAADETNGWAVGDKILTAGDEQVRVYDATAAADVAISVDAYNALSDDQKATALVKIETLVSHNSPDFVAYAEQAESYNGTKAAKISHAPYALETTMAFKEGDRLSYIQDNGVLHNKYAEAIINASNFSSYFGDDKVFVFETDFNFTFHTSHPAPVQFLIQSSKIAGTKLTSTMFGIGVANVTSNGTFDLCNINNSNTSLGFIAVGLNQGEWYNLRVEIEPDADAAQGVIARVYLNGVLISTLTKTYYNADASAYAIDLTRVRIAMTSDSPKDIILDNTYVATEGTLANYSLYSDSQYVENYDEFTKNDYITNGITNNLTGTKAGIYTILSTDKSDNVLEYGHIGKTTSTTVTFPVARALTKYDSLENVEKMVWETEFKINNAELAKNWCFKLLLDGGGDENFTFDISGGNFYQSKGTSKKIALGEWCTLRMEWVPETRTRTLYINGQYVYEYTATAADCAHTHNGVAINIRSAAAMSNFEMMFDNTYCSYIFKDNRGQGEYASQAETYTDFTAEDKAALFTHDKFGSGNATAGVVQDNGNDVYEIGHKNNYAAWSSLAIKPVEANGDIAVLETDFKIAYAENLYKSTDYILQLIVNSPDITKTNATHNKCIYFNADGTRFGFEDKADSVKYFETGVWYRLKMTYNKATGEFAAYINDVLVAQETTYVGLTNVTFSIQPRAHKNGTMTNFAIRLDNTYCTTITTATEESTEATE